MRHDGHGRELLLMDELGEIVDVARHVVIAVGRPLAVAVTAQVGRDDVPLVPQPRGDPIPVAAMIAPAVEQDQRRRPRIAPVDVMQAQTLGEIDPRGGTGGFVVDHMGESRWGRRACPSTVCGSGRRTADEATNLSSVVRRPFTDPPVARDPQPQKIRRIATILLFSTAADLWYSR